MRLIDCRSFNVVLIVFGSFGLLVKQGLERAGAGVWEPFDAAMTIYSAADKSSCSSNCILDRVKTQS